MWWEGIARNVFKSYGSIIEILLQVKTRFEISSYPKLPD